MAHLWSGRFEGNPDAALVAFGRSFGFDRRLFEDDVRGSLAWAAALARAGVLSTADAAAIETGLQEVLSRGRDKAFFDSPEAQARVMQAGACAYLRKPVDKRTLLDAIVQAVGSRNGQ